MSQETTTRPKRPKLRRWVDSQSNCLLVGTLAVIWLIVICLIAAGLKLVGLVTVAQKILWFSTWASGALIAIGLFFLGFRELFSQKRIDKSIVHIGFGILLSMASVYGQYAFRAYIAGDQENDFKSEFAELRTKLDEFQIRNDELSKLHTRREQDKSGVKKMLGELGVQSTADLKGNEKAIALAHELAEIDQQIQLIASTRESCDTAVVRIESLLRRLSRRADLEEVNLTTDEQSELTVVRGLIMEVDERLEKKTWDNDIISDVNVQLVLEKELGDKKK